MTRSRNPQAKASFTKGETKYVVETDNPDEKLIPKWVKSAGALAGIVVALLGAFVGIYQVAVSLRQIDVNIEKERRGSDEAKAKEAEEQRKKTEAEAQRSLAEGAARVDLRHKDLEVKNAEVAKETIAWEALKLSIQKDVQTKTLDERFKVEAEERTQMRDDNAQLTDTILGVFKEQFALPALARLTRYATPGDERLGSILTPLVAKLDDVKSPAEVNIIFQLFERAGPNALSSVIDSNRNALERYKRTTKNLALAQFNLDRKLLLEQVRTDTELETVQLIPLLERSASTLMSTQDPNTGLATLQRAIIEDVWDQIIRSCTGGMESYRVLRTGLEVSKGIRWEVFSKIEVPLGGESIEDLRRDLWLQVAILRQSKRSLLRLLKQTQDYADLTGVEVSGIRFLPGDYGSINFSDALVAGTDFSAASLDRATLDSLGEAYVLPGHRVKTNLGSLSSWSIRLSPQQREIIANGSRGGGN